MGLFDEIFVTGTDLDIGPRITFSPMTESTTISSNRFYDEKMLDYLLKETIDKKAQEAAERLHAEVERDKKRRIDRFNCSIKNVIFNDPCTIILWKDGTKTVVKCQEGDTYDKEKGFAIAIIKRLFDDTSYFNTIFKSWVDED